MRRGLALSVLAVLILLAGCAGSGSFGSSTGVTSPEVVVAGASSSDTRTSKVEIVLLQLNDVYEIGAVEGGRRGGLARVATLRERLLAENPRTLTLHAGDLLSPSAIGTAVVDGQRLDGRQMIAVLNRMELDYATYGNHEFDLSEPSFFQRIAEAKFQWLSANVFDRAGNPLPGTVAQKVVEMPDGAGGLVRIGLIGVTLQELSGDYVEIREPLEAMRREVEALEGRVDILVAVTHQTAAADEAMAAALPQLDLIVGGHEHENLLLRRGSGPTLIAKADANARTVFVHRLSFDRETKAVEVESDLVDVTDDIPEDPQVAAEVRRWTEAAFDGFREDGFVPEEKVAQVPFALDGREASVRNRSTRLTELIAEACLLESKRGEARGADLAFYNSGSIRIDDVIPPGPVTQYDIIRILPFGGPVVTVDMTGALVRRALAQGVANRGSGGFLQVAGAVLDEDSGVWSMQGAELDPQRVYRVAVTDFLLTGKEQGLDFLKPAAGGVVVVREERDVRLALISELQRRFGGS